MGAIIEARDLAKRFDGLTAVDHISFAVILWLRQLKLYFRSRARMIGALGQPAACNG